MEKSGIFAAIIIAVCFSVMLFLPAVSAQIEVIPFKDQIADMQGGEEAVVGATIYNKGEHNISCWYETHKRFSVSNIEPGANYDFYIKFLLLPVEGCEHCEFILGMFCEDLYSGEIKQINVPFELINIKPGEEFRSKGNCWCENNKECEPFECNSCLDCGGPGCWCDNNQKCEEGECPECVDCVEEKSKEPLIIERDGETYVIKDGKSIKVGNPGLEEILLPIIVFGILLFVFLKVRKYLKEKREKKKEAEGAGEKRKLSAIMFTDMKGFSKEIGKDEEKTLKKLWRYEGAMKSIIKEHDGRVVKTIGDAIMGDFDSAVNAVRAAMSIQRLLRKEDIKIRIGVHLGDVIHKAGDIFGDGVNIASRIESLCKPGEIYVSEDVYKQVKGKILAKYKDLGKKKLKNIQTDVKVYKVI